MTYRSDLNKRIDDAWIFSTRRVDWYITLERGFYISRDLKTMLSNIQRPLEYFYRSSMEDFADFVWYSRQNVRHAVIVKLKYIFLRKGYYCKKGLINFLE